METTKEISKKIRSRLKNQFPNCKFSVTSDYSKIKVALMAGNFNPFLKDEKEISLNHYYLEKEAITDEAKVVLKTALSIANEFNYDNSDLMADYNDVGFYFGLSIGKWDKHYTQTA
ncbi:MAG: LPD29 domain-containing protein [Nanoarchaeota archaeon]|nr:LPD29 domain-containing protein [Nanoarchaeota archaeon]